VSEIDDIVNSPVLDLTIQDIKNGTIHNVINLTHKTLRDFFDPDSEDQLEPLTPPSRQTEMGLSERFGEHRISAFRNIGGEES
jgi:hypothetical protein